MLLTRLEPETIPAVWPSIANILRPALDRDTVRTPDDLYEMLAGNHWAAWMAHGFAGLGVVVTELADDEQGHKCLFVRYVAGRAGVRIVREGLALLEQAARQAGCVRSSIGGRRGWVRAFPDYIVTIDNGSYVELRKAL